MTIDQQIKAISETDHDSLLKAQCISILREVYVESKMVPLDQLLEYACTAVGVTTEQAKSKIRKTPYVRARMIFIHFAKKWYNLMDMGEHLNRDHTTIMHNRDVAGNLMEVKDDVFLFDLENMERVMAGEAPKPTIKQPKQVKAMVKPAKKKKVYEDVLTHNTYQSLTELRKEFPMKGDRPNLRVMNRKYGNRFSAKVVYV